MSQVLNSEILVNSLDEFRDLALKAFRKKIRLAEREAEEAGWAVRGEFRVGAAHLAEPLLRICYVCEPGKLAQVVRVDGPEDCSALFSRGNWSATRLQ